VSSVERFPVGAKAGLWTITGPRDGRGVNSTYPCRCECGTERPVGAYVLWRGKSRSCGCLRKRGVIQPSMGERYGRWVVIGTRGADSRVPCRCECGTEQRVLIYLLRSGATLSCGCRRVSRNVPAPQEKFGRWTVLDSPVQRSPSAVECVCECGTRRYVETKNLRAGVSRSCGCTPRRPRARRGTAAGDPVTPAPTRQPCANVTDLGGLTTC
jgi:hypothetical protein